jgi:Rieske 2Fe-2S family protein
VTTFAKPSVRSGSRTLPAHWYTSADVFANERERIFAQHWICVGRAEQLERPGDFFTCTVADESLIVTRDAHAHVHAFFNVCRHRGTRICEAPDGHFSGSIQCPYHAWTYGLDGALMVARNMESVEDFDRAEYPLHEAGVAEFEGFLFVNVAREPQPFAQAFAPLLGRFAEWEVDSLRSARSIAYDLACNWKLVFLNYSECYHCPVVHPQLEKLSPSESGRNDLIQGPFLGGYSELRETCNSLTTSGKSARPSIGRVSGENLTRSYYYTIFPSLLFSLQRDYVMVHYVQPVAVDRTRVVCAWLFDPNTMAAPNFDPSDVVEFWDLTNRQDWHVSELTQMGVQSRAYTPGPYANAEGLLSAFDEYYIQIMTR